MIFTAYHHPGFAAPIGDHVMPMRKFQLVADALATRDWVRIEAPAPISEEALRRVHTQDYIEAVRTGEPRALAESQKLPWSPELWPSVRLTCGGALAAAERALEEGVAAALASGFHHSHADHGEGFCTFNGLVVAAEALRAAGRVTTVAVLDLDLHYGNGTASLCAQRPWLFNCSIYGNDYAANVPFRDVETKRHQDGPNHVSVALPNGSGREALRVSLDRGMAAILANGPPDLVLYQAGADAYKEDPYSPLELDLDDLRERDQAVFGWARQYGLPIAWVLAGGYTRDVSKVVAVHVGTFEAARAAYC
ncbi:MAG TPA: histone deacetylase [Myxococcota bacterium]|nr:histone deacetylase [Myxococcota bacterium]